MVHPNHSDHIAETWRMDFGVFIMYYFVGTLKVGSLSTTAHFCALASGANTTTRRRWPREIPILDKNVPEEKSILIVRNTTFDWLIARRNRLRRNATSREIRLIDSDCNASPWIIADSKIINWTKWKLQLHDLHYTHPARDNGESIGDDAIEHTTSD